MSNAPYDSPEIRRGLRDFGLGKIANGVLNFLLILALARGLAAEEYAAYLIFTSIGSLAMGLSALGLATAGSMFLPRYRLLTNKGWLVRFVAATFAVRFLAIVVIVAVIGIWLPSLASLFQVSPYVDLLEVFLIVTILETMCVFIQKGVFEPLLDQRGAQSTWFVRNGVFTIGLIWYLYSLGNLELELVVWTACVANGSACAYGLIAMTVRLRRVVDEPTDPSDLHPPTTGEVVRTSAFDYLGFIMRLLGNSSAVTLVAGTVLAPATLAAFGFALKLAEQVLSYMPSHLLWRLLQPGLVANYARTNDFGDLNHKAFLLYKAGLFVWVPVVAVFAVHGSLALDVLSAGRYGSAHWMMLGWLSALVPLSHEIVLWGTGMIARRPGRVAWAGVSSLMTVPVCILLTHLGLGAAGLIGSILLSTITYNTLILHGLRVEGLIYRLDWRSLGKLGFAGIVAAGCLMAIPSSPKSPALLAAICTTSLAVYLLVSWFLRPFDHHEREWMSEIAPIPGRS